MKTTMIALLTDFGTADPYVGIMKGIITDLAPNVPLIDLTHHIPPGDIQRAAFALWQAARDLPQGTVFLCVVDPGVGTKRNAVYLDTGGQIFIGPDNGIFSYLLYNADHSSWLLSNTKHQGQKGSTTFHGRDIFAPAAAFASQGIPGEQFGAAVDLRSLLTQPRLLYNERSIAGEILSTDHFGNLFTSLGLFQVVKQTLFLESWITGEAQKAGPIQGIQIQAGNQFLPFVDTFNAVEPGNCAGLIGSTGLLEIISNQGSAADTLGLDRGDPVLLVWD